MKPVEIKPDEDLELKFDFIMPKVQILLRATRDQMIDDFDIGLFDIESTSRDQTEETWKCLIELE